LPLSPMLATCPAYLGLIILIISDEECKLWSSLCSFLQPSVVSSHLGWNTRVSTLFSDTLSLRCSLNIRNQVSHPYTAAGRTVVLYILIVTFSHSRREGRRFWNEWQQTLPEFNLLLISLWIGFWSVTVVPKYLNLAAFSEDLLGIFILRFWLEFWWQDVNIYLVFSVYF
jgi:hypothetical protein